jgi:winged helix DNA-binding protein
MNRSDLISQRLHNQKLSSPDLRKPVEVVRWFGAVQSQDFEAAKWALALRMRSATHDGIEDAFNRGTILRTHIMRPTWHFVAKDDIRWLMELTAARVNLRCAPNYRMLELDDATFKRSRKVIESALRNAKHLSRSELRSKLNESGVEADNSVRMGHILLRAELDGVICSGPRVGRQLTYALFDDRVPATKSIDRDEALAKVTRLYFRSHGPATLQDFVWWSGLNTADARRALDIIERELKKVSISENICWSVRSRDAAPIASHTAHLLPAFDEYLVAYKDRRDVFDSHDGKPSLTTWDLLGPTVVINGTAAGTWKRTSDKKSIKVGFIRPLKKPERVAIAHASERYVEFLGLNPAQLSRDLFR